MSRNVLAYVVCCLVLGATASMAGSPELMPAKVGRPTPASARAGILFFDDMESGTNGWTTEDLTVSEPHFHVDSYLAFGGSGSSWWCGTFEYDADGGYGNNWHEWLALPDTDVSGAGYPCLACDLRYETEPGYDLVFVEAMHSGAYELLDAVYDGSSGGWQSMSNPGYPLLAFDNPVAVRFRFVSDGLWSDEDSGYSTVGGACHFDNIRIYDYYSGTDYFFDDAETGGLCTTGVPPGSGDLWHITDRSCPAYSDPHSWWCGDDSDTTHIAPDLDNMLVSPSVSIAGVEVCTMRFLLHAEVPTAGAGDFTYYFTTDGGATWQEYGPYFANNGSCDWWFVRTHDVTPYLPGTEFQFKIRMRTGQSGCGPGSGGGAGIFLDDFSLEDWSETGTPDEGVVPSQLAIRGNHPNPFNPTTVIAYDLPKPAEVCLSVYSVDGRCVAVLEDGPMLAGRHGTTWAGRDDYGNVLPSGVYFARLGVGEEAVVHRMVLLK